jgi:hypothetical protein
VFILLPLRPSPRSTTSAPSSSSPARRT